MYVISGDPEEQAAAEGGQSGTQAALAVCLCSGGGRDLHCNRLADVSALPSDEHRDGLSRWNHGGGTAYGRGPSVLASILGVAAFDFCFVPPYLTFAVTDTQYVFTFGAMLATGLIISELTARVRSHAEASRQREWRTAALYEMSRELAALQNVEAILKAAGRHLERALHGEAAFWLPDSEGRLKIHEDGGFVEARRECRSGYFNTARPPARGHKPCLLPTHSICRWLGRVEPSACWAYSHPRGSACAGVNRFRCWKLLLD